MLRPPLEDIEKLAKHNSGITESVPQILVAK